MSERSEQPKTPLSRRVSFGSRHEKTRPVVFRAGRLSERQRGDQHREREHRECEASADVTARGRLGLLIAQVSRGLSLPTLGHAGVMLVHNVADLLACHLSNTRISRAFRISLAAIQRGLT